MLNIPNSVKTLFKRDRVRKNFRVHFPNGELPDITNDNIVQESVKFTESLCSQDVLKFGSTESAVIEFETVGIGNMYGMKIECGIEIDLSSLSTAEINAIAAGTWDGVYTPSGSSDIGYAYFRVPYGTFRVESCPRDHQAMTHRKVVAYGYTVARISLNSPFELTKLRMESVGGNTYTPDLKKLIYAGIGWYNTDAMIGYTKTNITPWSLPFSNQALNSFVWAVVDSNNIIQHYIYITNIERYTLTFDETPGATYPTDQLYGIEFNGGLHIKEALEQIKTQVDSKIPAENRADAMKFIKNYLCPNIKYNGATPTTGTMLTAESYGFDDDMPVFYPKAADGRNVTLTLTSAATVYVDSRTNDPLSLTLLTDDPRLFKYTDSSTPIPLSFAATGERTGSRWNNTVSNYTQVISTNLGQSTFYTFSGIYDFTALLDGMLEINAQFGFVNRFNEFDVKRLSTASPIAVYPGEYSQFWWDEYDVLPIGSIKYIFAADDSTENENVYQFSNDPSIYDMTNNEFLKTINAASQDTIITLFDESFIPHLDTITFTPIELSMKGLPYLEAGDYLAVRSEDGEIAYSFIMRQEISGIQALNTDVESISGDIIDSQDGA